jgi:hypothetical protein
VLERRIFVISGPQVASAPRFYQRGIMKLGYAARAGKQGSQPCAVSGRVAVTAPVHPKRGIATRAASGELMLEKGSDGCLQLLICEAMLNWVEGGVHCSMR